MKRKALSAISCNVWVQESKIYVEFLCNGHRQSGSWPSMTTSAFIGTNPEALLPDCS